MDPTSQNRDISQNDDGDDLFERELPPESTRDPNLEIPEILRTPVRQPEMPGAPKIPATAAIGSMGVGFAIAFNFISMIGGGVLLGWLFDRWRGSMPVGTLVGLGVGFIGAFYGIIRQSQKAEKRDRAAKR